MPFNRSESHSIVETRTDLLAEILTATLISVLLPVTCQKVPLTVQNQSVPAIAAHYVRQKFSPTPIFMATNFLRKLILPLSALSSSFAGTPTTALAMAPPLHVRVASYNVLSSHLADPNHFSTLNPDHLYASNRLPVVLRKIDDEVQQKSIICLQEVSYDWAGSLHTHFANRGYHFVTGLYGKVRARKKKVVENGRPPCAGVF